jgi:D-alanyl-D-alanine carboxypeptidase
MDRAKTADSTEDRAGLKLAMGFSNTRLEEPIMSSRFTRLTVALALSVNALAAGCADEDVTPPAAPDLDATEIAEIETLADKLVAAGVPGVALVIQAGGQTVRIARGVEDLATNAPLTPEHHFRYGSVAKSVLSSITLQLVDEGKLRLGDTIESVLPGMVAHNSHATIEQVLRLQSGIFDHFEDPRYLAPYLAGDFGYAYTPEQLLALSNDHPAMFAPGERFYYSNTNYVIIGLIIQKLTGMPLADAVAQRITGPLGMTESTMPLTSTIPAPFAHGYLAGMGPLLDVTGISASSEFGHGNLVSIPSDVNRFYAALVAGKVVKPAQLTAMFKPDARITTNYGIGVWTVKNLPATCGAWIGHDAATAGYDTASYARLDGRRQISVAVTSLTFEDKVGDAAAQEAWGNLVTAAACK